MIVVKIQSPPGSGVLSLLKAGVEATGKTCNFVDMESVHLPRLKPWPEEDFYFVRPGKLKVDLNQFPASVVYLMEDAE